MRGLFFGLTARHPVQLCRFSEFFPTRWACFHRGVRLISVQKVTVRTCPDREDWRGVRLQATAKCLSGNEFLLILRSAAEALFARSNSAGSARFRCSL